MTGWLGTEYFLAAVLALFVVDRLGRRKLMMWGAAGMAASLLVIGASLSYATEQNKGPAYAATVFIFVYDTFFALGWLGVTWVRPPCTMSRILPGHPDNLVALPCRSHTHSHSHRSKRFQYLLQLDFQLCCCAARPDHDQQHLVEDLFCLLLLQCGLHPSHCESLQILIVVIAR